MTQPPDRCQCPFPALSQLLLNELKHEVDEFIHAGWEFLYNRGEVVRFGFVVVAAGAAPAAGVEGIADACRADEAEGFDLTRW